MSVRVPLIIWVPIAGYVVVVMIMAVIAPHLVGLPPAPLSDEAVLADAMKYSPLTASYIDTIDKLVTMLFTVGVGAVVAATFVFRDSEFRVDFDRPLVYLSVALMFSATVLSVYLAYVARVQAVLLIDGSERYDRILNTIGMQALAVAVSVGAALLLLLTYAAEKHAAPRAAPAKKSARAR